jgi:hypothetical protein
MDFIFVCPQTQKAFNSEAFEIIDNRGVTLDEAGNKILDAKVRLTKPCPHCGETHTFQANTLTCPFSTDRSKS